MASKYHNLSNEALADEIGRVDAIAKAAEAELKALKDEFKARGLKRAIGEMTEVTAVEQTANRLDTAKVRAFFGSAIAKYEAPVVSFVIRVQPVLARLEELAGERWPEVSDQAPTVYAVWGGGATPAQALAWWGLFSRRRQRRHNHKPCRVPGRGFRE